MAVIIQGIIIETTCYAIKWTEEYEMIVHLYTHTFNKHSGAVGARLAFEHDK